MEALPGRFHSFIRLFHDYSDDTEFKFENGDAWEPNNVRLLRWYIASEWLLYLIFVYFVLINYSYFIQAKSSTSASGYSVASS